VGELVHGKATMHSIGKPFHRNGPSGKTGNSSREIGIGDSFEQTDTFVLKGRLLSHEDNASIDCSAKENEVSNSFLIQGSTYF